MAAAVAAAQLIEDADADIGAYTSPNHGTVAHTREAEKETDTDTDTATVARKIFANLPDLYVGYTADVNLHPQQAELITNTKISCSSGMRWAGWLVLARVISRAQTAGHSAGPETQREGEPEKVFWTYAPESTAEACYISALQQILPWSRVCAVAWELRYPPLMHSGAEDERDGHQHIYAAGSAAAFRAAEQMCVHTIWPKLAQALPALSTSADSGTNEEEPKMLPFASNDIYRLVVTVLVEASGVCIDPSVSYSLLCLAREVAAVLGSSTDEAAILHAMAYVVRIGWPQSKGSDLYASELLLRAACAWNSSSTEDDLLGLVDGSAAAEQAQLCASVALKTALAHDDLVRAAMAAAAAESTQQEPGTSREKQQLRWLLELFDARRALNYEWFDCEKEAGRVPSAQQALFAAVHSWIC